MATWSYDAFESISSGRDGVTEMELRVTEKLDDLGPRAEYAKVVMTNVVEGTARAVVYYPDKALILSSSSSVGKWIKGDVNTIADDSDTERFKEEMYQEIKSLLNALTDMQAARSKISREHIDRANVTLTTQ